jgi:hypothetical protein
MDALLQEVVKYLPAGQAVSLVLLVWILYKVTHVNGSVIELKAWREVYEEAVRERFERLEKESMKGSGRR